MAGNEATTQPLPDKLPELAQLVIENEKLRRKHRKVQQRRDHYARLYYRCQADLDEKKWELHFARTKIRELKTQIAANSPTHNPSQGHPPLSSSAQSDIIPSHPPLRAHPHYLTQSHPHSYLHTNHHNLQQNHEMLPQSSGPGSIPPHPSHIPRHGSDSDSTSPDSGASFSPGMGMGNGVDPLLRSHPASTFSHAHSQDTSLAAKSKTLPRSMRFHHDKTSSSRAHMNGFASSGSERGGKQSEPKQRLRKEEEHKEGKGEVGPSEGKRMEGGDWVAWVRERKNFEMPSRYKVGVSAPPAQQEQQPREGWRGKEVRGEKPGGIAHIDSGGSTSQVSEDSTVMPRSPIHFKNSAPPPNILASPIATHRRHPSFEPKLPIAHGFSLSQGDSLPHSTFSPPISHTQSRTLPGRHKQQQLHQHQGLGGVPPHVHFSLSQEAYMSSPLYIRKPMFKSAAISSARRARSQTVSGLPDSRAAPVAPSQGDQEQQFSDSELEPEARVVRSAFCKHQPYRQLSHPTNMVLPAHQPRPQNSNSRPTGLHLPPSSTTPPDDRHTSHLPHVQSPPSQSTHQHSSPPHHSQQGHTHQLSSPNQQSTRSPHTPGVSGANPQRGVANPELGVVDTKMGVASKLSATVASSTNKSRNFPTSSSGRTNDLEGEEEEEEEETEEEDGGEAGEDEGEGEGEGKGECCYERLTAVQILDLLSKISDPNCTIAKLEIADSDLGKPEAMSLLCRDLSRNESISELSLPNNGIGAESLQLLLDCIQHSKHIRELKLRGNNIGKRCAPLIKALMEKTSLDSLVLTGNEIEQHGDLLHRALPSDFTMEYDTTEGSVDSGVVVEHYNHSNSSLKYLHV